jgi:cytosine/adenosine deaminase-related metal-dependent hydrolase
MVKRNPSGATNLAVALALPALLGAQTPDHAALRHLKEVEWPRIYFAQDVAALDALLAPEFTRTDGTGRTFTKGDELARVTTTPPDYDSLRFRIDRLEIWHDSTAIADGTGLIHVTRNDTLRITAYHSTNILVKRSGQWRAVASHTSGSRPVAMNAITDVHVISMTDGSVRRHRTVTVVDGWITAIDSGTVPVSGATVIDGRGGYLIPGLHDAYAHIDESSAPLFVAHGVTTVRNTMPGLPRHLALRDAIRRGDVLGPTVFTTGPPIAGSEPFYASVEPMSDPARAREVVRAMHRAGYDGIAVYVDAEADVWHAVIDEAHRLGLPVSGHRPYKVPSAALMRAGLQDSKDNLLGEIDLRTGSTFVPPYALDAYARGTAASGIVTIPTLTIHRMRSLRDTGEALFARPEMQVVPLRQRLHWLNGEGGAYAVEHYRYAGAPALVAALHRAGARILAGSDAGYPFLVAGRSLHEELGNLVAAGLSPFEALQSATVHAAAFLGDTTRGTIAVGRRADLVLLARNPLDTISNTRSIDGVMLRGRWLPRDTLAALLRPGDDRVGDTDLPWPARDPRERGAGYEILLRGERVGLARIARRVESDADTTWIGEASVAPHVPTWTRMTVARNGTATVQRITERHEERVTVGRTGAGEFVIKAALGRVGAVEVTVPAADIVAGPLLAVNLDTDLPLNLQMVIDRALRAGTDSTVVVARRIELNHEEFAERTVSGEVRYHVARTGPGRFRIAMPGLDGGVDHSCVVALADDGWLDAAECGRITIRRLPGEGTRPRPGE